MCTARRPRARAHRASCLSSIARLTPMLDLCEPLSVGFLRELIGNAVRRGLRADSAAAPATVSGERRVISPLGNREGGASAQTRKPGDLPARVVASRTRRAGCPDGAKRPFGKPDAKRLWFADDVQRCREADR